MDEYNVLDRKAQYKTVEIAYDGFQYFENVLLLFGYFC